MTTSPSILAGDALDQALAAIAEHAAAHDRDRSFPHEAFPLLHRAGALNLTVAGSAGGAGARLADAAALIGRLGQADPSVALVVFQHLIFHFTLSSTSGQGWDPDLLREIVESSIQGVALANFFRVEPELGTPGRGGLPATTAHRREGGFELRGHKIYCTGVPGLRWQIVFAKTDDPTPSTGSFVVEAGTPGYRIDQTWDHVGLRASGSEDVIYDGAWVPEDRVVGLAEPGAPVGDFSTVMAWNNVGLSALYTGVARSARDWLVRYLNERTPSNLGAPLASLPRFQQAVGEIEIQLQVSEQLIRTTAADVDAGRADPADCGYVKRTATHAAIAIVEQSLQLTGNPGLSRHNPLERHLRDALCGRVHTPQDDTIAVAAGQAALAAAAHRVDRSLPPKQS
jgi:alkylation response protein AidB-like acyl-CoA dehydrogenase